MNVRFNLTLSVDAELLEDGSVRVIGIRAPSSPSEVPFPVFNLRATAISGTDVDLAWDDGGGSASSWDVYRDDGAGGALALLANVTSRVYTDSTVAADTVYVYDVKAKNAVGDSDFAETDLTVDTTVPSAPTAPTNLSLNGAAQRALVRLVWDAAPAGENVFEWDVVRDSVVIATVGVPQYDDASVADGHTGYVYEIVARNSVGDSSASTSLSVDTPANNAPVFNLSTISMTVGVPFSLNLNTVCSDADGDTITYTLGTLPDGITQNGSVISGVPTTSGTPTASVDADDGLDTTSDTLSFDIAASTDVTGPSAPVISLQVTGSTATISLDTPSTDASGIKWYNVQRAVDGGSFVFRQSVLEADFPYVESGLAAADYDYRVRAEDNVTPTSNKGDWSNTVSGTVSSAPSAPDTPIQFSVFRVSNSEIDGTWQAGPSGAVPTSYQVDVSADGLNAQTYSDSGWTTVYTGSAAAMADTGLSSNTTYYYRVWAFNGAVRSTQCATSNASTASAGTVGLTGYDQTSLAPWRGVADTVTGWDFSYPPSTTAYPSGIPVSDMSGNFMFTGSTRSNFPSGFPGRVLTKINADWKLIEPTEGDFDFSMIVDALTNASTEGVHLDIRQSCRSYNPNASGAKGRQTCPDWLRNKGDMQTGPGNAITDNWQNDNYGQTTYNMWNSTWQAYHLKLLKALTGDPLTGGQTGTPAANFSTGSFRVGGYKLQDHPKLTALILHGCGGNSEEFIGNVANSIKNDATRRGLFEDWVDTWVAAFGSKKYKLANAWAQDPVELVDYCAAAGLGVRSAAMEKYYASYHSCQDQGQHSSMIEEAYKNQAGTVQTGNPYPMYMVRDLTDPRQDPNLQPVHFQNQIEEYSFQKMELDGSSIPTCPARYQQSFRIAAHRCLAFGCNVIAIPDKNNGVNVYGGSGGHLNPPLINWMSLCQGKKPAQAFDGFCLLMKSFNRAWNNLKSPPVQTTQAIHNVEYLVTQREPYGAANTTPALKRGSGVNSAVENSPDPADDDWRSQGVDTLGGYPIYPWKDCGASTTTFPTTLWHHFLAKKGTSIGFKLDDNFISGAQSVAVKVTYWDNNTDTWNLKYRRASDHAFVTNKTHTNTNGAGVRTTTFFLTDFEAQAGQDNDLIIESAGTTPFMAVRVIKL